MDDLTKIKGIGKATAKRLVDAGIASFAALAAALPEQFQSIDDLGGSPVQWAEWIAGAKTLAPAPVDLSQAPASEIDAQAARIDAARDRLDLAIVAVSAAQAKLGNGTDIELEQAIDAAEAERDAAQQALDLLIGPGDISRLDLGSEVSDASTEAATPAAPEQNSTITPPSEDEGNGGDGGLEAVSTRQSPEDDEDEDEVDLVADFGRALEALSSRIDRLAAESVETALSFIGAERARFRTIIEHVNKLDIELQRHEREVVRTETVWPLTVIRLDSVDRPIGKPLKVDPVTFTALTTSGAAADHAPPAEGKETSDAS